MHAAAMSQNGADSFSLATYSHLQNVQKMWNDALKDTDDPYEIKPHYSNHAPKEFVKTGIERDDQLLFYQQSRYPIHFFLGHTQSEVAITKRHVIIKQANNFRGGAGHPRAPYRVRQHVIPREAVAGYDAGAVKPQIGHLLLGMLLITVSGLFLIDGESAISMAACWLNPDLLVQSWRGNACRHFGLCAVGGKPTPDAVVPLKAEVPPGAVKPTADADVPLKPEVSPDDVPVLAQHALQRSGATFLELRASGHLRNQRPRSSKPGSFTVLSTNADGDERQHFVPKGDTARKTLLPKAKENVSTCIDFPNWIDSEGGKCKMYADPQWPFSCARATALGATEAQAKIFDARRDNTAFHLNALEACCICGGGQISARTTGLQRLEIVLWPMVLAWSASSPEAAKLRQAGKAVLSKLLREMDGEAVAGVAKVVGSLPAHQITAGVAQMTLEVEKLLNALSGQPCIRHMTLGLDRKTVLPPATKVLSATGPEASSQTGICNTAIPVNPLTMCALTTVFCVLWLVGVGLIGVWFLNHLFMDRIYVKLKVHTDSSGSKVEEDEVQRLGHDNSNSNVQQCLGFYLPPSTTHPYCLREMATALLLTPLDNSCTQAYPTVKLTPACEADAHFQLPIPKGGLGGALKNMVHFTKMQPEETGENL